MKLFIFSTIFSMGTATPKLWVGNFNLEIWFWNNNCILGNIHHICNKTENLLYHGFYYMMVFRLGYSNPRQFLSILKSEEVPNDSLSQGSTKNWGTNELALWAATGFMVHINRIWYHGVWIPSLSSSYLKEVSKTYE